MPSVIKSSIFKGQFLNLCLIPPLVPARTQHHIQSCVWVCAHVEVCDTVRQYRTTSLIALNWPT